MAKRLNCATCIYLNMHKKEFSENGHNSDSLQTRVNKANKYANIVEEWMERD